MSPTAFEEVIHCRQGKTEITRLEKKGLGI